MKLFRVPATHRLTALLAAGALALTACAGADAAGEGEEQAPEDGPSRTIGDPDTWPLTGLPVAKGASAEQRHPVLVLKMDNTSSSAPQQGLGSADLVVEELVEGGMTRLAAFYYSQIPGDVGPVRSMRASDIGIVSPVDGAVVTSGAAPVTLERIAGAGIDYYTEGSPGFSRAPDRSSPYNLLADLGAVADDAAHQRTRPDDYLPWGSTEDLPQGEPATTIAASFGGHTTNWAYRGGRYVNEDSYAAAGDEFPAESVLALRVPVDDAGYRDPAGNFVPETRLVGSGEALLFHDGRLVRGTWTKDSLDSMLELSTKAGPLQVPAGKVWIELVPQDTGGVTFGR